jgi:hypothetical protein
LHSAPIRWPLIRELAIGTTKYLSKTNQIRVEPNLTSHVLSLRRFQSIEWTHKGDWRSSDTKAKAMELVDSSQSRLPILSRA